jgi:broad specificity phosphatase PhoE
MKKFIIIRSGLTAWDEEIGSPDQRRIQGTLPLPLSGAGNALLDGLAQQLMSEPTDCLYSSGNESAGPTAACLARLTGWKTRKIDELTEVDCGAWQGLQIQEIKKRFARAWRQWRHDPQSACPPQGERLADALDRMNQALVRIEKKHRDDTVVVVAGRIACGLLECALTQCPINQVWEFVSQEQSMRTFVRQGEQWQCLEPDTVGLTSCQE